MKSKIKLIIVISFLVLLTSFVSVYAANQILASDITYKNGTVEDALNDLYQSVNNGGGASSYDMTSKTTLNNNHYQLTKSTLFNDPDDKIMIIRISADMIDDGWSTAFTVDISEFGVNSINNVTVKNYLSSRLNTISTSYSATAITVDYDPYYGRASKTDYDFALIIEYS